MEAGKLLVLEAIIRYDEKVISLKIYLNAHVFAFKTAVSILKQEYKIGETKLKDAVKLAVKILSKTLDTAKLTSDKSNLFYFFYLLQFLSSWLYISVEIATLVRENNKTKIRIIPEKELGELIKELQEEQAKLDAEKLLKEKAAQQNK